MPRIIPTLTAYSKDEYDKQLSLLSSISKEIHLDIMDGVFTSTKSPSLNDISWDKELVIDLHLMIVNPLSYIDRIIDLKPNMVLIQSEIEIDFIKFSTAMHKHSIKTGIVLLSQTKVAQVIDLLPNFDQVLIFSGHLGFQGGVADLKLLSKVKEINQLYPNYEISWDGGVNEFNIVELVNSGISVLNVGRAILNSNNPQASYNTLMLKLSNLK